MVFVPEVLRGIFPGWAGGLRGLSSLAGSGTDALRPAQASYSMSFMDFPASQATVHQFRDPGPVSSESVQGAVPGRCGCVQTLSKAIGHVRG